MIICCRCCLHGAVRVLLSFVHFACVVIAVIIIAAVIMRDHVLLLLLAGQDFFEVGHADLERERGGLYRCRGSSGEQLSGRGWIWLGWSNGWFAGCTLMPRYACLKLQEALRRSY